MSCLIDCIWNKWEHSVKAWILSRDLNSQSSTYKHNPYLLNYSSGCVYTVLLLVVNHHSTLPWMLCLFSVKFLVLNHVCISCCFIFHQLCSCILVHILVLPALSGFGFSWQLRGKKPNIAVFLESFQPRRKEKHRNSLCGESEALGWFSDDFLFYLQPSFPLSDPSRVPGHTLLQIIKNTTGDMATFAS